MKGSTSWAWLVLLQPVAFFVSLAALWYVPMLAITLVEPATLLLGIVLAALGCRRLERKGLSRPAFAVALVLPLVKWVLLWETALLVLGMVYRYVDREVSPLALALGIIWAPKLAIFSTGCQAYFGIGKFFSRLSFLDRVRALLRANREISLGRAAHPDQLARAEQLLRLKLPKSYRQFLRSFGELRAPSSEMGTLTGSPNSPATLRSRQSRLAPHAIKFLGITPTVDLDHPIEDCVGATLDGRERFGLPPSYILCSVDDAGTRACLDTFEMRGEEGPAVVWNAEQRRGGTYLARSFAEYLVVRLGGAADEFRR
jgi:hypothetical protein